MLPHPETMIQILYAIREQLHRKFDIRPTVPPLPLSPSTTNSKGLVFWLSQVVTGACAFAVVPRIVPHRTTATGGAVGIAHGARALAPTPRGRRHRGEAGTRNARRASLRSTGIGGSSAMDEAHAAKIIDGAFGSKSVEGMCFWVLVFVRTTLPFALRSLPSPSQKVRPPFTAVFSHLQYLVLRGLGFTSMILLFVRRALTFPPPTHPHPHTHAPARNKYPERQGNSCRHSSGAKDGGGGARAVHGGASPRPGGGVGWRPAGLGHVRPHEEEGVRRDRGQLLRVRLPGGRDARRELRREMAGRGWG